MPNPFWRNLLWPLLLPASFVWAFVAACRRRWAGTRQPFRAAFPVVCFGNLHSGGSGKTPLVIAATRKLAALRPVVVSRGYGSPIHEARHVDPALDDAEGRFGDEPVLIAKVTGAPVIVGVKRADCLALAAKELQPGFAILDDGFQHYAVHKDFTAIVVSGARDPRDSFCLPYGELRESWSAVRKADAIVVTAWSGDDAERWRTFFHGVAPKIPLFVAPGSLRAVVDDAGTELPAARGCIAFCGIAAPERFFRSLEGRTTIFERVVFPDHARYDRRARERLEDVYQRTGAEAFVTTEKDWGKVRGLALPGPLYRAEIAYEAPEEFWSLLRSRGKLP